MNKEYKSNLECPESVPYCKLNYKDIDLDNVVSSKFSNISGVIAVENSEVVLEKYFNNHKVQDTFHVASVTKSIISALIGIAIDKGYIKGVEEKVISFFPEYKDILDGKIKKPITIKDLLTMTVPYKFPEWKEDFEKLCLSHDWVKYTLDNIDEDGNIGDFKYSSEGAHVLSSIITKATNKSAREFANEYLFKPLGMSIMENYEPKKFGFDYLFGKDLKSWPHDTLGYSTGGWGLNLTLRDMALFGCLYINDGYFNNTEIVSESWVKCSTTPFKEKYVFAENKYGYLWWINHYNSLSCYSAVGDGGNIISCIPEKNLVIAVTAETPIPIENPYEFIEKYVIPYVIEEF